MTQQLEDGECQVWWSTVGSPVAPLTDLLDAAEGERARGLRHQAAHDRFVLGRVTARVLVARLCGVHPAEVVFQATCRHCGGPHGRLAAPWVSGGESGLLHLSVTHSGDRVAVAVARDVVCGVDVEQLAIRGDAPPVNALSAVERAVLDALPENRRLAAFIRYWTRKEAVLKATGDGLLVSPANLTVSAPDTPPRLLTWVDRPDPQIPVHLTDLAAGPGYRGAVATLRRRVRVSEHSADSLLAGFAYHHEIH